MAASGSGTKSEDVPPAPEGYVAVVLFHVFLLSVEDVD